MKAHIITFVGKEVRLGVRPKLELPTGPSCKPSRSYKRKSKILEESIRFVSLYIITNSTTVGFFQMR